MSVLDLKAPAAREHALVTVLQPHASGASGIGPVSVQRSERDLAVTIGGDRVRFEKTNEGWRIHSVSKG